MPTWVCEVLSPSNHTYDRRTKFPFYARVGLQHLWVVDPAAQSVEIKQLVNGQWSDVATFAQDERLQAEPFPSVQIPLRSLWIP